MKQIIGLIMLLTVGVFSCDKLPKNDDLDGMWHLQQVTSLNVVPEEEEDVTEKGIYWNVNLDLLQIYSKNQVMYHDDKSGKDVYHAYCRFEYTGTTLNVNKVYLSFDVKDSLLTDPATTILEPYGIVGCADEFNIEQLGSKSMILVSDDKRLVFRRF
jgi:hypothetical protein